MQLDLTDEETLTLLNLLVEVIEADRYPLSPRISMLRAILAKFGPMGPAPPPPARPPTPEERDPRRRPRSKPPCATPSIYDPARLLVEGMDSTWTQRSSCHSSNPTAPVFALMRRAITMASASFSQATPWI
jgi:hypothetical protein